MSDPEQSPRDPVLLDVSQEGVAVITLNRPEVLNALSQEAIQKLSEFFTDLEDQDGVRVIMIDGAGDDFCAGEDLREMHEDEDQSKRENQEDATDIAGMLLHLKSLPQPTIALVGGAAIGIGLGLAAACDVAIATQDASFALPDVKHGLIPATAAAYVAEAIGIRAARRYALTGATFDAQEALRLGLVSSVVADKQALSAEAEKIVGHLLASPPGALTATKELLDLITYMPVDEDLAEETAAMLAERRKSDEAREGVAAFVEKRKPDWQD